ncbi:trithorax group protein osa-like isoform X2 [Lutzomyia longipalpis]|uniref:trithorax group protein osa-like isoform X2 n=1 Tax=Lutzomyia longipalpis TaxID=7200 RepID=UPI0024835758|nr:trithorax group protein osa-like isoform X2 [Lutzomyia longipalpis]
MMCGNLIACIAFGLFFIYPALGHPAVEYEFDPELETEFNDLGAADSVVTREKKSYSSPTTICVEINPQTPYERSYMMCKEKRNYYNAEPHRPHYYPYVGAPNHPFMRNFRTKTVVPQKSTSGYISPHNMKGDHRDDRHHHQTHQTPAHGLPVQPLHLQDEVHHNFGKTSNKPKSRTFDFDAEAQDDFQVGSMHYGGHGGHGYDHGHHHDHYESGNHGDNIYAHHYYVPNKHSHGGYHGGAEKHGDDYHQSGHYHSHSSHNHDQDYGHDGHGYDHSYGHSHGHSDGHSYDHHQQEHQNGKYYNFRPARPLSYLHIRPQLGPIVPHKTPDRQAHEETGPAHFHESSGPAKPIPEQFFQPSGPAQHIPAQFQPESGPAHHTPAHAHHTGPAHHVPAPVHHAPAPVYHAPAPAYHAPAPTYHAPAPAYHAPAPAYHAPAPAYHAPAPVYHAPESHHQAPAPVYYEPYSVPVPAHYGCSPPPVHPCGSPAPSYGPPPVPCGQNYLLSCSPSVSPVGCSYQKKYTDSLTAPNPNDNENKDSDKDKPPSSAIVVQPTHLSGDGQVSTTPASVPVVGAPIDEKPPSDKDQQPKVPGQQIQHDNKCEHNLPRQKHDEEAV